jgi:hypothetical protein
VLEFGDEVVTAVAGSKNLNGGEVNLLLLDHLLEVVAGVLEVVDGRLEQSGVVGALPVLLLVLRLGQVVLLLVVYDFGEDLLVGQAVGPLAVQFLLQFTDFLQFDLGHQDVEVVVDGGSDGFPRLRLSHLRAEKVQLFFQEVDSRE